MAIGIETIIAPIFGKEVFLAMGIETTFVRHMIATRCS